MRPCTCVAGITAASQQYNMAFTGECFSKSPDPNYVYGGLVYQLHAQEARFMARWPLSNPHARTSKVQLTLNGSSRTAGCPRASLLAVIHVYTGTASILWEAQEARGKGPRDTLSPVDRPTSRSKPSAAATKSWQVGRTAVPALAPVPKAIERSGCCGAGRRPCQSTATRHKDSRCAGKRCTKYCHGGLLCCKAQTPSASLQAQRDAASLTLAVSA